jgi:hypothetical protein
VETILSVYTLLKHQNTITTRLLSYTPTKFISINRATHFHESVRTNQSYPWYLVRQFARDGNATMHVHSESLSDLPMHLPWHMLAARNLPQVRIRSCISLHACLAGPQAAACVVWNIPLTRCICICISSVCATQQQHH